MALAVPLAKGVHAIVPRPKVLHRLPEPVQIGTHRVDRLLVRVKTVAVQIRHLGLVLFAGTARIGYPTVTTLPVDLEPTSAGQGCSGCELLGSHPDDGDWNFA